MTNLFKSLLLISIFVSSFESVHANENGLCVSENKTYSVGALINSSAGVLQCSIAYTLDGQKAENASPVWVISIAGKAMNREEIVEHRIQKEVNDISDQVSSLLSQFPDEGEGREFNMGLSYGDTHWLSVGKFSTYKKCDEISKLVNLNGYKGNCWTSFKNQIELNKQKQ